jgi:hypothetical protein
MADRRDASWNMICVIYLVMAWRNVVMRKQKILPPLHGLGDCVFSVSSNVSLVQLDLAVAN